MNRARFEELRIQDICVAVDGKIKFLLDFDEKELEDAILKSG
jgi:hypothetical protein